MKRLTFIKALVVLSFLTIAAQGVYCQTVELWSTKIGGGYDDSWQPPSCEWRNEGFLGTPSLHCGRPRALRHEPTLSVYGPNDEHIRQSIQACVQKGVLAGVIVGVSAGVATGGPGATAAVQTFINTVAACIGTEAAQSISAAINDSSHWVEL